MIDLKDIRLTISVGGKKSTVNVADYVTIDEMDLSGEFIKQGALLTWWGVLSAGADHAQRSAAIDVETEAAAVSARVRTARAADVKKPTEDSLKEAVRMDPAYIVKKRAAEQARYHAELISAALKGIEEKGKMLQSLGAYQRSEMGMIGMATPGRKGGGP